MRESYTLQILSGATGKPVDAEMYDRIEANNLLDFDQYWRPAIAGLEASVIANPRPAMMRVEDAHWNWAAKIAGTSGQLAYRHFALECDGRTQGLMQLELTHRSRTDHQHLVYIDFLAVAPWNRKPLVDPPLYKAVGTLLFAQAVGTSFDEGFGGRIGLHSLPGAAEWYRNKSMTSFGLDDHYENLEYFELDERQAEAFMATLN